jgi:amino acid adenylation domain-containing protein
MQAGMLYRAMLGKSDGRDGYDIEQLHVVLSETLSPDAFAQAWTLIARRHSLLSSSFYLDGTEGARQRVEADVVVAVRCEDWTGVGADERAKRLEDFLASDRRGGFQLARAPLMRVTVFRVAPGHDEFVWTFHHILLDGRSIPRVLVEVFDVYASLVRGETPAVAPPPRPYRDYIAWLATRDRAGSLDHFRRLLRGRSAPSPLPLAEPAARPLAREGYGEIVRLVEREVVERALAFVDGTKATMGTLVQAAWAVVLARTTGQDDVLYGVTRACRRSALGGAAEDMVGLFINSLPVRVRVADDHTVASLLAALRAQSVAVREHEHTPLVDIQGVSEIPRGMPLFETLVMFENRDLNRTLRAADPSFANREATLHEQPSPPLCVTVVEDGGEMQIRLLFDRTRYADGAVSRIADCVAHALAELSRDADRKLADVDILPRAERRRILVGWNETARPFARVLLHAPFEARALAQPDAVAVECDAACLTYAELDARANRLARLLVARGASPGVRVGLCLERDIDLVVALVASAKSGAAYVPLDPAYPVDRLTFMAEDAELALVVTEKAHEKLFSLPRVVIDGEDAPAIASMPATAPPRSATPGDACYAIYTSGSTGRPKGVVLTHEAVVNTFDWVTRTLGVGPGDRLLFVTSPCFDLSVYDTFGALGAGATVVVASRALLADAEALAAAIVERRITIWDSAPAALQRLVPFFGPSTLDAPLRQVMLSGDRIPLALPDAVRAAFPKARVTSLGGATEAAIWSNFFPIGAIDPRWTSVPYGRPIQNARYHVLDDRMRPVAVGVTGDLYIGGACLAQGYLRRPELTAERFVPDPFSDAPGERLYKTGDLARYFEDGELEFLGRADFQVKIRGFRVELGEVEAVLAAVPGVEESACVAWTDASGENSLIAYVVPREGVTLEPDRIRAHVAEKLPAFMVPSRIMVQEAMPLSSNGKVDRKALPLPSAARTEPDGASPSTELEHKMVAIWRDLLQRDRIGVTDDFFDLGGHSLLAVTLVSRVKRDLGVKLSLSSVMQKPTIRGLVATLVSESPRIHGPHIVALEAAGAGPPLFLVSGAGGYGFGFRGVARIVGGKHPVYALNAIGAEDDEGEARDRTIEEMASIYLPQVLSASAKGRVVIGGYSFGVLVAFELAHRLRDRGREVPLIVSFDGFAPGFPRLMPLPRRLLAHARELFGRDPKQYVKVRLENIKGRVLEKLGRPEDRLPRLQVDDAATDNRLRRLEASLWHARSLYNPAHKLEADLLLFKTSLSERWVATDMSDPNYGWGHYTTGRIDVVNVEGAHRTMFGDENQRRMADAVLDATARLGHGAW